MKMKLDLTDTFHVHLGFCLYAAFPPPYPKILKRKLGQRLSRLLVRFLGLRWDQVVFINGFMMTIV
ncbi:hypothetical protein GBA52_019703 [Prunus armeniaca]|nr:hypothetical protein GBA52_019703 [Prunus armeniaca]